MVNTVEARQRSRRLRKYTVIYKATLMENLQYVFNIVLGFVSYFMLLFIFISLWDYMYSDSSARIAGYTKEQMMWYVLITEMLWFGTRTRTVTRQVSNDIRQGNIAYQINKPYHYTLYVLAKYTGEWSVRLPVYAILSIVMGITMVGWLPGISIYNIPFIIISVILGITIDAVLRMCVSLIAFWIEDAAPFQWLYDKLILVVGTIFPIEIFPKVLQGIFKYTPIYVVTYGPAKLIVDFSMDACVRIFTAQIIYLAVGFVVMFTVYAKGVRKLNVYGG